MSYKQPRFGFEKEYFLLLLPLFFSFHGYVANYPLVPLADAVRIMIFYFAAIAITSVILFVFVSNWRKAALVSFAIFCFQLFFGLAHDRIKDLFGDSFITKYTVFVPVVFILLIACIVFIKISPSRFSKFVRYLNLLFFIWIFIDGALLLANPSIQKKEVNSATQSKCDTCAKPDIYFIIADEYAGNKALQEIFRFDNSAFEEALKRRGFHIVKNSVSNYNYTPYSVASILSMNYINGITAKSNDLKNRNVSYGLISDNNLIQILKQQGYGFKNFSVFDFADLPTTVDNMFFLTREKLITGQTFTHRFKRDIAFNFVTRFKIAPVIKSWTYSTWEDNENLIRATKNEASRDVQKPRFIYTHLLIAKL